MEHFELVEKLVNTFGVSYEKAKEALEASNWDAIDAAIYLEREKNSAPVQTEAAEIPNEPQPEPIPEPAAEEPKEEPQPQVNTAPKGSTAGNTSSVMDDMKKEGSKLFKVIWDFLTLNSFVVKKNSGEVFLDVPIWLAATLLIAFFWAVILILGIVFIMGYRFSFSGPQLGKKNIKNTVDQAENAAGDFVEKVKNSVAPDTVESVEKDSSSVDEEKSPEIIIEPVSEPIEEKNIEQENKEGENETPSEPTA